MLGRFLRDVDTVSVDIRGALVIGCDIPCVLALTVVERKVEYTKNTPQSNLLGALGTLN